VVITDKGKVIGTQAFIPIRMIDERGVFWTVKSEETLVDADYRGQKLFEKMYDLLFDFLKQHRIHCIWGFTPATRAFQRLGFAIPRVTSQLFVPFTGAAVTASLKQHTDLARQGFAGRMTALAWSVGGSLASTLASLRYRAGRAAAKRRGGGLDLRVLDEAPPAAGDLSERFIRLFGGTTIHRDATYLQWRFFENPYVKATVVGAFAQGQLVGWIAYALGDDGMGYIVDLMVAPLGDASEQAPMIVSRLLRESVDALRCAGALGVRGWHVTEHPVDAMILKEARALGFYHVKRGHTVVLYTNQQSDRAEAIASFDRWFVTRIFTEGALG